MTSGTTTTNLSASSISTQVDEQGARKKISPGPWWAHVQPPVCRSGDGIDYSIMNDDGVIALIAAPGKPDATFFANLAVLGASWDMLEALQQVLRSLTAHNEDRESTNEHERCDWDFGQGHNGTFDVVRAAIAKATGATQS